MLEDKIRNLGGFLFRFSLGSCVMDSKKWRWSDQWMKKKSSRSTEGKDFPNLEMLDARIASALNKIIQNSHFKKKGQSGGTESSERGSVSSRQTDRLHDLRLLPSDWFSWYRSWFCWFILYHSSQPQCSGLGYDMGWNSIVYDTDPEGRCSGKSVQIESDQLKTVWELYDMEIHQKISMPNYQKLKTMVKRSIDQKLRLRKFKARNEKIETGAAVTSCRELMGIERGKGECCQWKAKGECSKGDQCSLRHESNDRAKPTPKTAPPSVPPAPRGRSASRKKKLRGRSPSGKSTRQPCKNFLRGTCTRLPCDYWHPPESQFYKTKSGSSAQSSPFRTGRLRNSQIKGRRRVVTKVQWQQWKMYDGLVAYCRTSSR